ncbi:MAG: hypothetical protein Q7J32_17505 [Sphingomonadaceae bacterium]|nr:hypothetical protein [Sphingomonadaceae bacterium]
MASANIAAHTAHSNVIALFPDRAPAPIGSTNSRRNSLADNEDAHAMAREIIELMKAHVNADKSPARTFGGVMGIIARYGALTAGGRNA